MQQSGGDSSSGAGGSSRSRSRSRDRRSRSFDSHGERGQDVRRRPSEAASAPIEDEAVLKIKLVPGDSMTTKAFRGAEGASLEPVGGDVRVTRCLISRRNNGAVWNLMSLSAFVSEKLNLSLGSSVLLLSLIHI